MKKDKLYQWCDQLWLHVLYGTGIMMSCFLIVGWSESSIPSKLMYLLTIMVPLHVFEENTLPGGFFFMNNLGQKSDKPMMYDDQHDHQSWRRNSVYYSTYLC